MLKRVLLATSFAVAVCLASGAAISQTFPAVQTGFQAFSLTQAVPTAGPVVPMAAGALYCAVYINAPNANFVVTPQGSNDQVSWLPITTIGGGSIRSPGLYLGLNPYRFFRAFFGSFTSPGISGYEACSDNTTSLVAPALQGSAVTVNSLQQLTAIGHAGCAGFDSLGNLVPATNCGSIASLTATNPITSTGGGNPVLSCVTCQYPVYNPEQAPYGCVFDGVTNVSSCMQSVINAASAAGGGTVALPLKQGFYSAGLTVPAGVDITCPKAGPIDGYLGGAVPPAGAACVMLVTDTVNPQISLTANKSTISNVTFFYPNQVPNSATTPTVYPPTIQTAVGYAGTNIVGDTFLNSYDAIFQQAGGEIRNDNIGAYHRAVNTNGAHDYLNISNLRVEPYWDLAGALCGNTIDTWVKANNQMFTFVETDGAVLMDIQAYCGGTGVELTDDRTDASYGQLIHSTFQSVTTGIYAQSTHSGPGWQIYDTAVGTLTGGHPIALVPPVATSPPQITSAAVLWEGGVCWNPSCAVLDNDPNADFQIKDVPGITGTISQVGTGQAQSNVTPAQIFPAREFTGGIPCTIPTEWLCFGAPNSASSGVFGMGNANGPNHYTIISATNAKVVQGVTDTIWGVSDAGTPMVTIGSAGNVGVLGSLNSGGALTAHGGTPSTPQHYTGTCTISSASTCNATQTVVVGSACSSQFTSNPVVDSTHTLTIFVSLASGTLTTTVNVAQGTNTTATPTWNTVCL